MTKQEILDAAKYLYEMERSTRGYATLTTELASGEKLTITPRSLAQIFLCMEVKGFEELTTEEFQEAVRWADAYTGPIDTDAEPLVCAPNSIHLVYADGHHVPFSPKMSKSAAKGVTGIGVIYDGHTFQVALKSLGEWPLVRDVEKCPEESPFYKTECEGLHDWDFIAATKHIQEVGTDIPLPEGWYIPTLAVLEVMCFLKEDINKALKFAGGEPMPDDTHWSCTEGNRNSARNVYFYTGTAYTSYKYYGPVVRAVAAFDFEAR